MQKFTIKNIGKLAGIITTIYPLNIAFALDYTKCTTTTGNYYCLNNPDGSSGIPTSLTVTRGSANEVVLSLPVKNCRVRSNKLRGNITLMMDNSGSTRSQLEPENSTDPTNQRLVYLKNFIDDISSTSNGNKDTSLGVISYGGMSGEEILDSSGKPSYEEDGFNRKVKYTWCRNADTNANSGGIYPKNLDIGWKANASGGFYSICEFLQPVATNVVGTPTDQTTPSISRQKDFLTTTSENPRGATDMTFFYEAMQQDVMFPATKVKNAIVITDGLPNIPKKVPKDLCTGFLSVEKITSLNDPYSPKNGEQFCTNRQFRVAVNKVNKYVEDNYATKFKDINVYNILFVSENRAFMDRDDEGELNPAEFLIENSARTGNGKVKFKYAKNKEALAEYLTQLKEVFDETAVQKVEVQVNSDPAYVAVTSSYFNKSTQYLPDSIKLLNLKSGANNVTVRTFYGDMTTQTTFTVTVNSSGAISEKLQCSAADCRLTIDGDELSNKTPTGDGVLPKCNTLNTYRIYRNGDLENLLTKEDFLQPKPIPPKVVKKLRLQGGTGNCGVIASSNAGQNIFSILFLLLPLAVLGFIWRKKA